MIRTDPRGPRGPSEPEMRLPRRPKLGPDFPRPSHNPRPSDLRRWKRKPIAEEIIP